MERLRPPVFVGVLASLLPLAPPSSSSVGIEVTSTTVENSVVAPVISKTSPAATSVISSTGICVSPLLTLLASVTDLMGDATIYPSVLPPLPLPSSSPVTLPATAYSLPATATTLIVAPMVWSIFSGYPKRRTSPSNANAKLWDLAFEESAETPETVLISSFAVPSPMTMKSPIEKRVASAT